MMAKPVRVFTVETKPTGPFPLLIGIEGPPGGGKTLSALLLAAGMKKHRGGHILVIDTEGGRSRKYQTQVPFSLVLFDPPFRSLDFLEAVRQQVTHKPACIVIDSMSDEHEGEGGVLSYHADEVERMVPDDKDWKKREAVSMAAAWVHPKSERTKMIAGLLRINTPMIFTFRARDKTKPIKDTTTGKMVPTKMGYQAIAPAEIVHAMDLMCLLPPRADGKPIWKSEVVGEDFLLKLPNFLKPLIGEGQFSEEIGEKLAVWASGAELERPNGKTAVKTMATPKAPAAAPGGDVPVTAVGSVTDFKTEIETALRAAAEHGMTVLQDEWETLVPKHQKQFKALLDRHLKPRARAVDEANTQTEDEVT